MLHSIQAMQHMLLATLDVSGMIVVYMHCDCVQGSIARMVKVCVERSTFARDTEPKTNSFTQMGSRSERVQKVVELHTLT